MKKYKTIIIDDEQIARDRLKDLLLQFDDKFDIIAQAKNGIEGYEMINKYKPDIIFLDIEMPGKNGFEMLQNLSHQPQVVFCTAFDQYALKAFETLAIDYLVKPIIKDRLEKTIDKLDHQNSHSINFKKLLSILENNDKQPKKITTLTHKVGDKIILVHIDKITFLKASEKYVEFFTFEGEKHISDFSIKKLLEILPDNFYQIKRGIIVNSNHIKEYRKYFRGKYLIYFKDKNNSILESGRSFSEQIKKKLYL